MRPLYIIFFSFFCLSYPGFVSADEIREIIWATPEWGGYTDKDGTGIYNEIMEAIFDNDNTKLTRKYVPWKRALSDVRFGNADMTGCEIISTGLS